MTDRFIGSSPSRDTFGMGRSHLGTVSQSGFASGMTASPSQVNHKYMQSPSSNGGGMSASPSQVNHKYMQSSSSNGGGMSASPSQVNHKYMQSSPSTSGQRGGFLDNSIGVNQSTTSSTTDPTQGSTSIGIPTRANLIGMLTQYRHKTNPLNPALEDVSSLEGEIVTQAISRLATYKNYRSSVDEKYSSSNMSAIEKKRLDTVVSRLEEAQYELKSLRTKLARRDHVIQEQRAQLLTLANGFGGAKVAPAQGQQGMGSSQGSFSSRPETTEHSSRDHRDHRADPRQNHIVAAMKAGIAVAAAASRSTSSSHTPTPCDPQTVEHLSLLDTIDECRAQLASKVATIQSLEVQQSRDLAQFKDMVTRYEQREVQLFDRLASFERECITLRSTFAKRGELMERMGTQVSQLTSELTDSQQRTLDVEGQLQLAQQDGEHMADELGVLQKKVQDAENDKMAALEEMKTTMARIQAEARDDLRDRYEALVQELDELVSRGLQGNNNSTSISASQEAQMEHGISFNIGGDGTRKSKSKAVDRIKPRTGSPPGGDSRRTAVAALQDSSSVNDHARGSTPPIKSKRAPAGNLNAFTFDEDDDEDGEEEEQPSREDGLYRRMQELEDKLSKEKVKVSLLTTENITMQQKYRGAQNAATSESKGQQMLRELMSSKEAAWTKQRAELQKEVAILQNSSRDLLFRLQMNAGTMAPTQRTSLAVKSASMVPENSQLEGGSDVCMRSTSNITSSMMNIPVIASVGANACYSDSGVRRGTFDEDPTSTSTHTGTGTGIANAPSHPSAAVFTLPLHMQEQKQKQEQEQDQEHQRQMNAVSNDSSLNVNSCLTEPSLVPRSLSRSHVSDAHYDLSADSQGPSEGPVHEGYGHNRRSISSCEIETQTDPSDYQHPNVSKEVQTSIEDTELPIEEPMVRVFRGLRGLTRQQFSGYAEFLVPLPTHFSPIESVHTEPALGDVTKSSAASGTHPPRRFQYPTSNPSKPLNTLTAPEAQWRIRKALLFISSLNNLRNIAVTEVISMPSWDTPSTRTFIRCLDLVLQSMHALLNPQSGGGLQEVIHACEDMEKLVGMECMEGMEGEIESKALVPSVLPAGEGRTGAQRGLIRLSASLKDASSKGSKGVKGITFPSATRPSRAGIDALLDSTPDIVPIVPTFIADQHLPELVCDVDESGGMTLNRNEVLSIALEEAERQGVGYNQIALWKNCNGADTTGIGATVSALELNDSTRDDIDGAMAASIEPGLARLTTPHTASQRATLFIRPHSSGTLDSPRSSGLIVGSGGMEGSQVNIENSKRSETQAKASSSFDHFSPVPLTPPILLTTQSPHLSPSPRSHSVVSDFPHRLDQERAREAVQAQVSQLVSDQVYAQKLRANGIGGSIGDMGGMVGTGNGDHPEFVQSSIALQSRLFDAADYGYPSHTAVTAAAAYVPVSKPPNTTLYPTFSMTHPTRGKGGMSLIAINNNPHTAMFADSDNYSAMPPPFSPRRPTSTPPSSASYLRNSGGSSLDPLGTGVRPFSGTIEGRAPAALCRTGGTESAYVSGKGSHVAAPSPTKQFISTTLTYPAPHTHTHALDLSLVVLDSRPLKGRKNVM